uniref:Uncharacterized protein n=1 Tax=Arundo donax TaxID=35708 RepID=A0A0A9AFF1_ARUDO
MAVIASPPSSSSDSPHSKAEPAAFATSTWSNLDSPPPSTLTLLALSPRSSTPSCSERSHGSSSLTKQMRLLCSPSAR